MAFSLQDLAAAATAVKWLYDNGFDKVNSAELQYLDLKQEVKNLSENLEQLVDCTESIEDDASAQPLPLRSGRGNRAEPRKRVDLRYLLDACGDFRSTIDECRTFLMKHVSYGRERSAWEKGLTVPLSNILWNNTIKSSVTRFRSRIEVHNRKIQFALQPLQMQMIQDSQLTQRTAYQHLARLLDNNTRRIESKIREIYQRGPGQGNTSDDDEEEDDVPLVVPEDLVPLLDRALETSLPDLEDARNMKLKDGFTGVTYHLNAYLARSAGVDRKVKTKDYLNLMKSVYLLTKIHSCKEYDREVKKFRSLFWVDLINNLEESVKDELERYSTSQSLRTRLQAPSQDQLRMTFLDDFLMTFESDQKSDGDAVPGITLNTDDEMLHLPLGSSVSTEVHELGLVRRSDLGLELRHTKNIKSRAGSETIVIPINLQKAIMIPLWALESNITGWHMRFRGDSSIQTEGKFLFLKARDQYSFQQAVLGYRVFFNGDGKDVAIRLYDTSGGPKDTKFFGKFEIWHDEKMNSSNSSQDILKADSSSCLSPTASSLSQTFSGRSSSRRLSVLSIPSSFSTNRTGDSVSTYASTHTSPITSPDGNVNSILFYKTTEPMLVLLIREDDARRRTFQLLGIKLDPKTTIKLGCNLQECRRNKNCAHATVFRSDGSLNVLRVRFGENNGWNIAALGLYQQDGQHVERPPKMHQVHLGFASQEERSTFVDRFNKVKQIWLNKNKALRLDMDFATSTNVRKNSSQHA